MPDLIPSAQREESPATPQDPRGDLFHQARREAHPTILRPKDADVDSHGFEDATWPRKPWVALCVSPDGSRGSYIPGTRSHEGHIAVYIYSRTLAFSIRTSKISLL